MIVIATGGFDPIHSGHIAYLEGAYNIAQKEEDGMPKYVFVGLNSDEWLTRKKGKPFMTWDERFSVLNAIKYIDAVFDFDDSDGSAINAIIKVVNWNNIQKHRIIFANGGDRTIDNIPEMNYNYGRNIEFVFGVGGTEKLNSSSNLLKKWENI